MTLTSYVRSQRFRKYLSDWLCAVVTIAYFFLVAEHAKPFNRQFRLDDPNLQHPFTHNERVTGHMCLFFASVVPSLVILVVSFVKHSKHKDSAYHLAQVSILGLAMAVSANGVLTDILKGWVGRPRPDFLARCGAPKGTPLNVFQDISICTAPLGERRLVDGMRSTPSGHSSISFSAFGFLSLWLFGQWKLATPHKPVHHYIGAFLPLLFAAYVALSRVQDYRHHFSDIVSGGLIGISVASAVYRRFFFSVWSEKSDVLDEEGLPI